MARLGPSADAGSVKEDEYSILSNVEEEYEDLGVGGCFSKRPWKSETFPGNGAPLHERKQNTEKKTFKAFVAIECIRQAKFWELSSAYTSNDHEAVHQLK